MSRFVIRTLEGYPIGKSRASRRLGYTVWVADDLVDGKELRIWRSENFRWNGVHSYDKRQRIFAEARAFAAQMNAEHSDAEAA